MPQIPTTASPDLTPRPQMSPEMAGAGYAVIAKASQQNEALANYGIKVEQLIQNAEDTVLAQRAERMVREAKDKQLEGLKLDTDWETLPQRTQETIQSIKTQFQFMYRDKNPRLWNAIQQHLDGEMEQYRHAAELRRIDLFTGEGKAGAKDEKDKAASDMAAETDPIKKEIIAGDYEKKTMVYERDGILTPDEGRNLRKQLRTDAENAEVISLTRSNNPNLIQLGIDRLEDPKNYPHLDQKEIAAHLTFAQQHLTAVQERADRMLDAQATTVAADKLDRLYAVPNGKTDFATIYRLIDDPKFREENNLTVARAGQLRTFYHARETEYIAKEKVAHDEEEKQIGTAFAKGNLAQVSKMITDPNSRLTGDERRTWKDAIDVKRREGPVIDQVQEARNVANANDMIVRGVEPSKIRAFIVQNLHGANLEQYLIKLDTKLGHEVEEGRRVGYSDIKDIILPPTQVQGVIGKFQSPKSVTAIQAAQTALDSWISNEIKAGKSPTKNAIRVKAHELAQEYQVSLKDKIGYTEEQLQEFEKAMKK